MQQESRRGRLYLAALATEVVLMPAVGAGVGYLLDQRFQWAPYGMLGGLILGSLTSARMLWVIGRKTGNE